MDFKKYRQGGVTRVQEIAMPSFTPKDKQVEVTNNVSIPQTKWLDQMALLMDKKIAYTNQPISELVTMVWSN